MLKKYLTAKWLLRLALPALVIIAVALALTGNLPFDNSTNDLTPEQKQASQINADNKKRFIENGGSTNPGQPDTHTGNSSAPQANNDNSIALSARRESNNSVTILSKLYGYSSGSCQLKVTNGVNTDSQTAEIIYQSQFSTCAGFSVPVSKLGNGVWSIKLTTTSEGAVKSRTISFEVK
jgi:hypothetical protein